MVALNSEIDGNKQYTILFKIERLFLAFLPFRGEGR